MSETRNETLVDRRIFKYPLAITDEQTIEMPDKAEPIAAQFQDGGLVVWAFVDASQPPSRLRFRIIGTGNPVEAGPGRYLATVQDPRRPLVWHVFWS